MWGFSSVREKEAARDSGRAAKVLRDNNAVVVVMCSIHICWALSLEYTSIRITLKRVGGQDTTKKRDSLLQLL